MTFTLSIGRAPGAFSGMVKNMTLLERLACSRFSSGASWQRAHWYLSVPAHVFDFRAGVLREELLIILISFLLMASRRGVRSSSTVLVVTTSAIWSRLAILVSLGSLRGGLGPEAACRLCALRERVEGSTSINAMAKKTLEVARGPCPVSNHPDPTGQSVPSWTRIEVWAISRITVIRQSAAQFFIV